MATAEQLKALLKSYADGDDDRFLAISMQVTSHAAQNVPRAGVATLNLLDVGRGDAVLIRAPEGKAALVDAGPSGNWRPRSRRRSGPADIPRPCPTVAALGVNPGPSLAL